LHERRDSLSLRDVREESQRLQEMMALSVSAEEEDEDDKLEPPVTVVLSLIPFFFNHQLFSQSYCMQMFGSWHLCPSVTLCIVALRVGVDS